MLRQSTEETGTPTDGWTLADGLEQLWAEIPIKYGKTGKPKKRGDAVPYCAGEATVLKLLEEPYGTCTAGQVQVPGNASITIHLSARER